MVWGNALLVVGTVIAWELLLWASAPMRFRYVAKRIARRMALAQVTREMAGAGSGSTGCSAQNDIKPGDVVELDLSKRTARTVRRRPEHKSN